MMCTAAGLFLMSLFLSALASFGSPNRDIGYLPTHQRKLLKDYYYLQNYLNAEDQVDQFQSSTNSNTDLVEQGDETAAASDEDFNNAEMQDDDLMATVQVNDTGVEVPFYGNEKKAEIIKTKSPGRPPKPGTMLYKQLKAFMQEVVVLLVTINENEIWCGLNYMYPPVSSTGSQIPPGNKNRAINFYDQKLNSLLTLGMFAEHKTALIQAKMGDDARVEIENALALLPNVQLVAGVGVAYGRKEKTQFGDVLVATTIDGIGNVRWDNGNLYFYQGDNRFTRTEERAIQVFGRQVEDFATITGFKVTKQGRAPEIHPKLIVSAPWLVNDLDILNKIIQNDPRAVGGEMEGQIIAGIHNDFLGLNPPRKIDAIIIKGVADYADGMKHKGWQMTAGLAAVGYTRFKLKQTNGQVYKLPESTSTPGSERLQAPNKPAQQGSDLLMKLKRRYEDYKALSTE